MTYKKSLLLIVALLLSTTIQSQIKIDNIGRVIAGPNNLAYFDPEGILSMSIQGRETEFNNAGSKLAFGDFGRFSNNGWNVFIGEYGNRDSDILWLHGKRGIRMTVDNGNTVVGEFGCDENTRVVFRSSLHVNRLSLLSNDASKSNIQSLGNALNRLLQLNSISYLYVNPRSFAMTPEARRTLSETDGHTREVCRTDKERADSVRLSRLDSIRGAGSTNYGFMTSQIEQLFPELVVTDGDGNKYVDYVELIPVIVAALNEQQTALDNLYTQLQDCCQQTLTSREEEGLGDDEETETKNTHNKKSNDGGNDVAILFQNTPNPFSETTTIEFYVPKETEDATLYIFTLNGILSQTHKIVSQGKGCITISGSALSPGMYVYTLVVDGQIVDSKRMILTQ